ncbi:phage minor structural protein, N-terminal region [Paenibacillus sophorae]|uniref:Phage minor structural protein, N-terminal region n=1 Tax=Paenibacillus sophorae TaxID=1333845 RepID=A0A1H8L7G2_9BACL|nr:phage tail protein [Paenibacillus sophorae]QWU17402.1 phage tail protein [Paenibacillus sophorae]SEO01009.1 phage minor structural protein, N-terminal region [Paenibacillus sophorae]
MQYLKSFDRNRSPTGLLVSVTEVQRRRRINSDYELSFMVPMTSDDYKEKIIPKGHVQDERGQFYVVQSRARDRSNKALTAQIVCTHIMFKMIDFKIPYDQYIDEAYGIHISTLLDKISAATGGVYTFVTHDTFDLRDVKDWGRTTALAALQDTVNLYGCEIEPDNFVIHLYKKIGSDKGFQYRLGKNIISDTFKDDSNSLVTRMYSQMKDGRTFIGLSTDNLTVEELSLLQSVPGSIQDGKIMVNYLISPYAQYWTNDVNAFYDGELIDQNIEDPVELLKATREALRKKEMPEFEIGVSAADIHKIDNEEEPAGLGDTVYAYDPDMEMTNISCRVMELTEYPFARDKHSQATLANYMLRDDTQVLADLERSKQVLNDLLSGGRVRASAFEEFAKQAVIDINNSKSEIIYDSRGIVLQDVDDHNIQVIQTSRGIIITEDGGATARTAITGRGIAAEVIAGVLGSFVSMEIGEGNNVTKINTNGISAGHADFNSAPFRLDMAGNLLANSLTANYANILSSHFQDGDIVGSSINIGSGRFTVSSAGYVYADGGFYTGGTVTGAIIRTADPGVYPRVEIDPSSIAFGVYSDENNGILIPAYDGGMSRIKFLANGNESAIYNSPTAGFNFVAYADARIVGAHIYLSSSQQVHIPSWSSLYSEGSYSSLQEELNAIWAAIAGKASANHTHSVTLPTHNHGNVANQNWGGTFQTSGSQ